MSKTLFYRLFGFGGLPRKLRPVLEAEGIVLCDEGFSASIIYRKYRDPRHYYGRRWSWLSAALVLTQRRFLAHTPTQTINPMIDVALDDERLRALDCSLRGETLVVGFDPGIFDAERSGSIECRFETAMARQFLEQLHARRA